MQAVQAQKLSRERLPRLALGLVLLVALAFVLWRARRRVLPWALAGAGVYLVVFNLRYVVLSHRTYSLTTVGSANDLIMYALVNTLLAFLIGWLVFVVGTRLFFRRPVDAARLTLGWALLAALIVGLPALVSFVVNGPLIRWTLPEMWSFFLGFLVTVQILFIAVFGILFAGLAAVIARVRRPAVEVA